MGNCAGCMTPRKEKNQFDYVLETSMQTGMVFNDSDFPPSPESLIENWKDSAPDVQELVGDWK